MKAGDIQNTSRDKNTNTNTTGSTTRNTRTARRLGPGYFFITLLTLLVLVLAGFGARCVFLILLSICT
ncbi:hypothetical protein K435DRAFT_765363 [Dendrothele bispora CBS 962.96]|uniref:Uncharacterized protein n=1 Tax=Dendrothele bispora (strain CBS 962.96) TaxID=1314807 RepID=A0A4S8L6D7_DENBC|nr:hypothetical protein K435DRAFT_765363 [Dendrothele bispora CBS 962.96]